MTLKLVSNGFKCKFCNKYALEEIHNAYSFSAEPYECINHDFLRKFKCRLCLATHIEIDKNKKEYGVK